MAKVSLSSPLRVSENEISLQNQKPLQFLCRGIVYDLPPGATIYMEDKAQYSINVIEDENYNAELWRIVVAQTNPCEDPQGRVVLNWQTEIAKEKEKHLAEIDRLAEDLRGKFITLGAGQAMVYQQKTIEARRALENPEIDPEEIPHVAYEADDEGVSIEQKATEIVAVATAWMQISAEIERRRLAAKRAVREARDLADVDEAFTALDFSALIPQ